jgi:hypothetical protein
MAGSFVRGPKLTSLREGRQRQTIKKARNSSHFCNSAAKHDSSIDIHICSRLDASHEMQIGRAD